MVRVQLKTNVTLSHGFLKGTGLLVQVLIGEWQALD